MKREEVYLKHYLYEEESSSHGRSEITENSKDNIDEELSGICFHIGEDSNPVTRSTKCEKYLFFGKSPNSNQEKDCQCFINVEKGYINKTPEDSYTRQVSIEIMPDDAKLPSELEKLLKTKGFKKH